VLIATEGRRQMAQISDVALCARIRSGRPPETLMRFSEKIRPLVCQLAHYQGGVAEEEVMAAIRRGVWYSSLRWRPGRSAFTTYAVLVAKTELLNVVKPEYTHRERFTSYEKETNCYEPCIPLDGFAAELAVIQRLVLRRLGPEYVGLLQDLISQRTLKEIAEKWHRPVSFVFSCKRRLQECLKEEGG